MARTPRRQKLREGSPYAVDAVFGSFDTLSAENIVLNDADIFDAGDIFVTSTFTVPDDTNRSFTNTSYGTVDDLAGHSPPLATNYEPVAKFGAVMENNTDGETVITCPEVFSPYFPIERLTGLEATKSGTGADYVDSGWVNFSNLTVDSFNNTTAVSYSGKVSGGEGTVYRGTASMAVGIRLP